MQSPPFKVFIMKNYVLLFLLVSIGLVSSGCLDIEAPTPVTPPDNPDEMTAMVISDDFDYATTSANDISLILRGPQDMPIPRAFFRLYEGDAEGPGSLIATGQTDENGSWSSTFQFAPHQAHLYVQVTYPGIPDAYHLSLDGPGRDFEIGGSTPGQTTGVEVYDFAPGEGSGEAEKTSAFTDKFTYMGTYNSDGVPTYLTPSRDVITQDILDLVANSLPEGFPVPDHNPQYIADSINADTRLQDSAEVWVTFVHEGAGYRNVLGYYTYDLSSPPATKEDIDSLYIVFPNVSFSGSGGGLISGDKVYLGSFPANTGIGWFLVPNAWSSSLQALSYPGTGTIKFSNKAFNDFTDVANSSHVALLKNDARQLLLLGMEDIDRPGGDRDFNDAVFYITASPYEAIITEEVAEAQTAPGDDDDDDDVINENDAYPNDPDKAFDLYFPGEDIYGTVAFEDLWPYRGDYDFNDLVVDYQYKAITNTANKVVSLEATFILKAIGAGMSNGFGFELNVPAATVSSVTGAQLYTGDISVGANGVESGQSKAVIIAFDDAHQVMSSGAGRFVNTEAGAAYITPDTIRLSIDFTTPQNLVNLGSAPFNPFIFTGRGRGYEIHLPNYAPTDLVDATLYQTGNDDTDPSVGRYFKDPLNLPWAIHVPVPFDYPYEKVPIIQAHLKFASWAQSRGVNYSDWYGNKGSYRSATAIYD